MKCDPQFLGRPPRSRHERTVAQPRNETGNHLVSKAHDFPQRRGYDLKHNERKFTRLCAGTVEGAMNASAAIKVRTAD